MPKKNRKKSRGNRPGLTPRQMLPSKPKPGYVPALIVEDEWMSTWGIYTNPSSTANPLPTEVASVNECELLGPDFYMAQLLTGPKILI